MNNTVLLLISLAVLGLAFAAVFQHEVHWRESLKTKLRRQGHWREYHALRQQLHEKFSNFKSSMQNLGNISDYEYYVNVTIGTPDQFFSLSLTLITGNLIVPDITCDSCINRRKFNSSKSSTYQKIDHFPQNNSKYGLYGQDFVRLGNTRIDQVVIPKAVFVQLLDGSYPPETDGNLGLGFVANSAYGIDPPIITAIKSGILDNPVVTIFLGNDGSQGSSNIGGAITYGAVDTVHCDRNVVYEPLSDPNYFEVYANKVSLGSSEFSGNWTTFFFFNIDLFSGPQLIIEAFAKELNATDYLGQYQIDCKAKFNLDLTIGTTVYTLTEKELMIDYGQNICIFDALAVDDDTWSLGSSWFRTYCNVLDYSNKKIGFAKPISS